MSQAERVPVSELLDLAELEQRDPPLTPRKIRAALPRGWALDEDGEHARRDLRLLFREGWILAIGLLVFGSVGAAFLWSGLPKGWTGVVRFLILVVILLVVGGLVGPFITRALNRRHSR